MVRSRIRLAFGVYCISIIGPNVYAFFGMYDTKTETRSNPPSESATYRAINPSCSTQPPEAAEAKIL